jgi:hypothetical protein
LRTHDPEFLDQSAKNANEREHDWRFMTADLAAGPHPDGDPPSLPNSVFFFAFFAD